MAKCWRIALISGALGVPVVLADTLPDDEQALARGLQYVRDGSYEQAIAELEPLVRTFATVPGAEKRLAQVHLGLGMALLLGTDDEKAAVGHFREAVRHDSDVAGAWGHLPPRVTRLFEEGREKARGARRDESRRAAWAAVMQQRTSGDSAALKAALEAFLAEFQEPSPERAESEGLLKDIRSARARTLMETPPDAKDLGRQCKATYVSGKSSVGLQTDGKLLLSDPERLVFLARPGGPFHAIPYTLVKNVETGLSEHRRNPAAGLVSPFLLLGRPKSRHYMAITYDDLASERQSVVFELSRTDMRSAATLIEMRLKEVRDPKPSANTAN